MTIINDLLPIGSVVLLKGGQKRIMIYGVKQSDENEPDIEYDYIGVMYPEGNLGSDYQFLFNHENIDTVVFTGFEDEERTDFIKKLSDYYNEQQ